MNDFSTNPSTERVNHLGPTALLDYQHPALAALIESRGWRELSPERRIANAYNFVKNEIAFGYNEGDELPASRVLADGYGQCNTKGTLLMALLRGCGIPSRFHGFTIDKRLQKGAITGIAYWLAPQSIVHSWVEVWFDNRWVELEGFILDPAYLSSLQARFATAQGAFCGYGAATPDLKNPQVEWAGTNTYIQKEGINHDYGVFDSPDAFYQRHGSNLSGVKRWLYQRYIRAWMNTNVDRIRRGLWPQEAPPAANPQARAWPAVDFHFQSRGIRLAARRWLPETAPRAVVVIVHGWGAHSAKYADVAQVLNRADYAVLGFDFEGHGQSPGVRAQVRHFDSLVDDLAAFLAHVDGEFAGLPVYLCGHSMGGSVVATYLALRPHRVNGAIFHASGLMVSPHISRLKKRLARILGGAWPGLPLLKLTCGKVMSRDPVEVAKFDQDPLTYQGKMTAGTGQQLLLANEWIGGNLHRVVLPFLALQGTADRVVAPEGASALYVKSPATDKLLRLYPDALHDLFHDVNRAEVLADLVAWLDQRTPTPLR